MERHIKQPFTSLTFKVRHEYASIGVEAVDDHLAIDRSRDLHAPIADLCRDRRAAPVGIRGGARGRLPHSPVALAGPLKMRHGAAVELQRLVGARLQQRAAAVVELVAQIPDEAQ